MTRGQDEGGGRQGAVLLLAAGLFTLVNNYLPGSEHLDIALLNAVGLTAAVAGAVGWFLPWDRWHRRVPLLVLAPLAFGMLAAANTFGGVSDFSYAVYFVVVFVWLGIAQPPRTAYWTALPATAAYVLPFVLTEGRPATAIPSVTVAIPVCVLVAETLARQVRRQALAYADVAEARARLEAVTHSLADGLAVLDADGRVTTWNEAAERLSGTPASEAVGAPPPFLVGPPGIPAQHQLATGSWVEVLASPVAGSAETVVTFRDMTAARALEEAKDLFLATTSHELRTPLTVVKGYVHMLQRRGGTMSDVDRKQALDAIAGRTDALIDLVTHLLVGARAGAGSVTVDPRPLDLLAELDAAVDGFRRVSDRHAFEVAADSDLPAVLADRASTRQVLDQLLENAVKYSPHGGTIRVEATRGDRCVVVAVDDEGVGIPAGEEERVFTRFYQSDPVDRRRFGGVGLGLHIVATLVRGQGGTVGAGPSARGGARVWFTLPLVPVQAAARLPEPA